MPWRDRQRPVSRRALIVAALLLAAGQRPPPGSAQTQSAAPSRKPAEVMSFQGADWLERTDRVQEERPDLVLQAMELKDGEVVADVGCGTGFFSRRLAKAVAPTGRVYAEDIQPEMLDLLKKYAARDGIANIVPVLGTETDPKLPPHGMRWVLLADVYHEFQQPEEMLSHIRESLAPGGRVALVEFRLEGESAARIRSEHRMSVEQVLAEWNRAGFELVKRIETLPSQHLFIFAGRRGARPAR